MKPTKQELEQFIKDIKDSVKAIKGWDEGAHWTNKLETKHFVMNWVITRKPTSKIMLGTEDNEDE